MKQKLFGDGKTCLIMYLPDKEESVLTIVKDEKVNDYVWAKGEFTGETGQFDEHYEIKLDDPSNHPNDPVRVHYEDIKEATPENIEKYEGEIA